MAKIALVEDERTCHQFGNEVIEHPGLKNNAGQHGRVRAQSVLGEGTSICFTLPLAG